MNLILVSSIVSVVAQLSIRAAMLTVGPVSLSWPSLLRVVAQPLIWLALSLYAAGFFIYALSLSKTPVSVAYPMLAAGYVVTPLVSSVVFKEPLSVQHIAGAGLVALGIAMVGSSQP